VRAPGASVRERIEVVVRGARSAPRPRIWTSLWDSAVASLSNLDPDLQVEHSTSLGRDRPRARERLDVVGHVCGGPRCRELFSVCFPFFQGAIVITTVSPVITPFCSTIPLNKVGLTR
jgi:hypothetical protein